MAYTKLFKMVSLLCQSVSIATANASIDLGLKAHLTILTMHFYIMGNMLRLIQWLIYFKKLYKIKSKKIFIVSF